MANGNRSELRKTLHLSTIEGVFAQIHFTIVGNGSIFLTKFAQLLGATQFHFGLLTAIGQFSQIFQPLGVMATRRATSRKWLVVGFSGVSRVLALFFGLLPFFFDLPTALDFFLLLVFFSIALQAVGGNAWLGWMADMVPIRVRGRFFAWRGRVLMVAGFVAALAVSVLLDEIIPPTPPASPSTTSAAADDGKAGANTAGPAGPTLLVVAVFSGIFVFASITGIFGLVVLARQPERAKPIETESFSVMLAQPFFDRNFLSLLAYTVWWMAAIGIASSYWQPFMLEDLRMSLVETQIYGVISVVSAIATLRMWGRFIDRYGNKPAMRIAIVLGCFNPLVWVIVTESTRWLIFIEAVTSGIMWAGAGLVAQNFVLAIAPIGRQQMYSGVLGAISGVAMMATTLTTAAITAPEFTLFGFEIKPAQTMFLIAGLARLTTQIPLTWVHEPRSVSVATAIRHLTAKFAFMARPHPMVPRR